MENNTDILNNTMVKNIVNLYRNFNVSIRPKSVIVGPSTTLIEVIPGPTQKISGIISLEEELTVALSAKSVRISVLPGRGTIGIEITNDKQSLVPFEYITQTDMELPIFLGQDVTGNNIYKDLTKAPHLLVGGSTSSGKSIFINTLISSIIESKANVKFIMIDPKKVELSVYKDLGPNWFFNGGEPITDATNAIDTLNELCTEMDARYEILKEAKARNIIEGRAKGIQMSYIVCVIDEYADLVMTSSDVEKPIIRIAQLARAVGIHVVLATQRPSAQVVTGLIKANFPTRICFKVASGMDSRVVLDRMGGQKLLGNGDMLFLAGSDMLRIQCSFIDMQQVEDIVTANTTATLISKKTYKKRSTQVMDETLEVIARMFYNEQTVSATMLQRRFKYTFSKAVEMINKLADLKVVTPYENYGSKLKMSFTEFLNLIK